MSLVKIFEVPRDRRYNHHDHYNHPNHYIYPNHASCYIDQDLCIISYHLITAIIDHHNH